MKKMIAILTALLLCTLLVCAMTAPVLASDAENAPAEAVTEAVDTKEDADADTAKAWAAGIGVALTAAVGAISMGLAVSKATDGMARQPEAASKINTAMMMGLVFIETAIIYALIVAILIIFVL